MNVNCKSNLTYSALQNRIANLQSEGFVEGYGSDPEPGEYMFHEYTTDPDTFEGETRYNLRWSPF